MGTGDVLMSNDFNNSENEKQYSYYKSELTGLFVITDEKHREVFSGIDNEHNCNKIVNRLNIQEQKIKELEERNNRQYERLTKLGGLILSRDWDTLEKIVESLEKAEERLQTEGKATDIHIWYGECE